jgi:hypothetical protein
MKAQTVRTQKTTEEIRQLIKSANMDFDTVINEALNGYLPRIFLVCPFTDDFCINKKQCIGCESYLNKP